MSEEKEIKVSDLNMVKIQTIVEEIISKGRSLYNNDSTCYTKGRGINDNSFIQNHCTKEAIKEMIGEKLDLYPVGDILSIISYSMLHYYIIAVERSQAQIYPQKDKDRIKLQMAYAGELEEKDIREFAEHVLYYCCRIYYFALVEKKRKDKEDRKKEEQKLLNTGSVSVRTNVQSNVTQFPQSRVTPPVTGGYVVNGIAHHPNCTCESCKQARETARHNRAVYAGVYHGGCGY